MSVRRTAPRADTPSREELRGFSYLNGTFRVVVADAVPETRRRLCRALGEIPILSVEAAGSAEELMHLRRRGGIHVCMLDVSMGQAGNQGEYLVRKCLEDMIVVVFGDGRDVRRVVEYSVLGVCDVQNKPVDMTAEGLYRAVRRSVSEALFCPPLVRRRFGGMTRVIRGLADSRASKVKEWAGFLSVTPRNVHLACTAALGERPLDIVHMFEPFDHAIDHHFSKPCFEVPRSELCRLGAHGRIKEQYRKWVKHGSKTRQMLAWASCAGRAAVPQSRKSEADFRFSQLY